MMALGARGSQAQMKQLVGMRLIAKPSEKLWRTIFQILKKV